MGNAGWLWTFRLAVRRRRTNLRAILRVLTTFALLTFTAPLAVDLIGGYNSRTVQAALDPAPSSPYEATFSLSKLKFQSTTQSVTGNLQYTVSATSVGPNIDRIYLAVQEDANGDQELLDFTDPDLKTDSDGTLVWLRTADGRPKCQLFMAPELTVKEVRHSAYYPFDSYTVGLKIIGCANVQGIMACKKSLISTKEVTVSLDEQHFSIAQELGTTSQSSPKLTFVLRRPFFVRWVSIWIGAFLVLFLIYLAQLSDPKDLIIKSAGYFGTMWAFRQLVVPPAISIFPTAIDYWILVLFGILFIVVISRTALGQIGEFT